MAQYRRFLFAVLAYYVTDIGWGVFEAAKLTGLLFADTTVYFIVMAAGVLCWTHYAVVYLGERYAFSRFLIVAGQVLASGVTLLTVANVFRPILFTVDGDCVYRAFTLRYVILVAQIMLPILVSAHAIQAILRSGLPGEKRRKYRTLASFGVIMAVFLTAQLRYPYLPLYSVAYMLGTSVQRALVIGDEKEAYRRGLEEAAEIRKHYDNETAVVVLTAYSWDDISEEAQRVGVKNFLTKPLFAANAFDEDVQRSLQTGMNAHLTQPIEPNNLFRALAEQIYEAETRQESGGDNR